MKKIIYICLAVLLFINSAFAFEIEGGVKYDVDSAREYLQEAQVDSIQISGPYRFDAESAEKVVYSYNNSGDVVGITVQYINEPTKGYIYDRNGKLIYMDKYDKPVNIYPHRGYRYKMDGALDLTTLSVSKIEQFRFSPSGKLLAHAINGIIYDEAGNVIGRAK